MVQSPQEAQMTPKTKTFLIRIPEAELRKFDQLVAEAKMNRNTYFLELLQNCDPTHNKLLRQLRNSAVANLKKN